MLWFSFFRLSTACLYVLRYKRVIQRLHLLSLSTHSCTFALAIAKALSQDVVARRKLLFLHELDARVRDPYRHIDSR